MIYLYNTIQYNMALNFFNERQLKRIRKYQDGRYFEWIIDNRCSSNYQRNSISHNINPICKQFKSLYRYIISLNMYNNYRYKLYGTSDLSLNHLIMYINNYDIEELNTNVYLIYLYNYIKNLTYDEILDELRNKYNNTTFNLSNNYFLNKFNSVYFIAVLCNNIDIQRLLIKKGIVNDDVKKCLEYETKHEKLNYLINNSNTYDDYVYDCNLTQYYHIVFDREYEGYLKKLEKEKIKKIPEETRELCTSYYNNTEVNARENIDNQDIIFLAHYCKHYSDLPSDKSELCTRIINTLLLLNLHVNFNSINAVDLLTTWFSDKNFSIDEHNISSYIPEKYYDYCLSKFYYESIESEKIVEYYIDGNRPGCYIKNKNDIMYGEILYVLQYGYLSNLTDLLYSTLFDIFDNDVVEASLFVLKNKDIKCIEYFMNMFNISLKYMLRYFDNIICLRNEALLLKICHTYLQNNTITALQNKVWKCILKNIEFIDIDVILLLISNNYIKRNNIPYLCVLMLRFPRLRLIEKFYKGFTIEEKKVFLEELDINQMCRIACYGNLHNIVWISNFKEIPYKLIYLFANKSGFTNICDWIIDTYYDGQPVTVLCKVINSNELRQIRRIN
jgi:hypothetical protein